MDMDSVIQQTVQQLGAENALLRLELNALRAALDAVKKDDEQTEEVA